MEATLAGPLSPLVLVIGGAVVTGAIVFGVVAGPGTIACIQRGDFVQCMSQTVFGGDQSIVAGNEDESSGDVASVQDSEDTILPDFEQDGESAADVAAAVMPAFGIVRVEPDGSAVIAGTGTPSGEVQIYANDEVIGTEMAAPSGDWAHVTASPLPPGGLELRIFDVEANRFAEETVVVVVQDDRSSEPLVVAIAPGEASDILQAPEDQDVEVADATDAAQTDDVAAAAAAIAQGDGAQTPVETPTSDETAEPETVEPAAAEPSQPETTEPDANSSVQTATEESVNPDSFEVAQAEEAPAGEAPAGEGTEPAQSTEISTPVAADAEAEVGIAPSAPIQAAIEDEGADASSSADPGGIDERVDAPMADDEIVPSTVVDETPSQTADAEAVETAPSNHETETAAVDPEVVLTPPSIDAVEIDGDLNFFAGAGTDGYVVRLYVDNSVVATTSVVDGRWLIEAIDVLDQPSQRVRIDMLDDDGTVVGRAEVNFVLDIPEDPAQQPEPLPVEDEERMVVAEESAPQAPSADAESNAVPSVTENGTPEAFDPTQAVEPAPEGVVTEPSPVLAPEAAPTPELAPTPEPAPAPETGSAPEPAAPSLPESVAPDTSTSSAAPAEAAPEPEPAEIETQAPAVEAPAQTAATPDPVEPEVPTIVGVTEGDRTVAGRVIIRRGDNLWTIARRVYGEGIRYTQIYDANTGQIRDPDLIYPGQVFDLPGTDVVIGSEDEAQ